ncbi:efflux RND transporter periplasmic adaptor subunit [Aureliella helgolandensis]|uniref:Putative efflux pump membrane fusion protein n=1 Tax=Aureliella helgolandensis TaxID=2527968 RepID=A0A518GAL9_9BACT|nr:HlyD family efflux transporter periplasmic adaptor subunit [Aureliella helgolandensis]QDV25609.1 putative efflux pump membrane fusion protein [Aureliella helgolandensis]
MTNQPSAGMTLALCVALSTLTACQPEARELAPKAPRPVTTLRLEKGIPESSNYATANVSSWKTENLGFEVSGRLQWVIEPSKNIKGTVSTPEGEVLQLGTPLAQIDPARYLIAVDSALADLEVAKLKEESIRIRLEESLPVEIESATANLELARTELERMDLLVQQNSISRSEFDQAENLLQIRDADLKALLANSKQAKAELLAAASEIGRAEQVLKDTQRDLANTTLYGSYNGQVAKVMVVPGSVVTAGSPVLTLQMTNPIKAEIELSVDQSRALRRQRSLPVSFTLPDGCERHENALVYNIESSADSATRTFTMTLLMMNEPFRDALPGIEDDRHVARAQDIWPIQLNKLIGADEDLLLIEETSILRDDQGAYFYIAENARLRDVLPKVFHVRKVRILENDLRIPFLGNWIFRSVTLKNSSTSQDESLPHATHSESLPSAAKAPAEVTPTSMYVGKIETNGTSPEAWTGDRVILESGIQWMLRPGDLLTANLSPNDVPLGFYVPIEAIYEESESAYIFIADDLKARQLQVELVPAKNLDAGEMIQIVSPELSSGMQIIVGGVHFLQDGQPIRVVHESN